MNYTPFNGCSTESSAEDESVI